MEKVNCIANLQLLEGSQNIEKQDSLPEDWLNKTLSDSAKRDKYIETNDLVDLPLNLAGFIEFIEGREKRIREKLLSILGLSTGKT
jgi:hypothetical protein